VTTVILALGSNLGDRLANLRAAVRLLGERAITPIRSSSVWETAPLPADQPAFLNAALVVETSMSPRDLLAALKAIEHELGRRPVRRWGPRPIDLDILFYGAERITTPELTVPHERIRERAFVLAPLAEAWPGKLPVLGVTAAELLESAGSEGIARTSMTLRLAAELRES
jgi:2-amino-4-hydroxy-6-hydroxymethyldihydropteridine diphosphokinase